MFCMLFLQLMIMSISCSTVAMGIDFSDSDAYLGPDYSVFHGKKGKKFEQGFCKKSSGVLKAIAESCNGRDRFQERLDREDSDEDAAFNDETRLDDLAFLDDEKTCPRAVGARGEAAIAARLKDHNGAIRAIQDEAMQFINSAFKPGYMKSFSHFHSTLVYTRATCVDDVKRVEGQVESIVEGASYLDEFDTFNPYMLYGGGALRLFGTGGIGKKFIGIEVSVDRPIKWLADDIARMLPCGDARVSSKLHISIGEVGVSNHDDNQRLQNIIDSGTLRCKPFEYNVTKVALMRSLIGDSVDYRIAPSYKTQQQQPGLYNRKERLFVLYKRHELR